VSHKPSVCCSLPSAVEQTLDAHCQAGQPYRYTDANVRAITHFVLAPVSFNQRAVDLALIKQARGGPCPIKYENCLAFCQQLEETQAHHTANAICKEAYQKSLATRLAISLADRLAPAASTLATPIALKLILIDFKKIQGKDCVKIFQLSWNTAYTLYFIPFFPYFYLSY
jgi:hypothetical protein